MLFETYKMKKDEFYLKIANALSGCQLVEQELKLYLTNALEFVSKCIGKRMPFKMKGEDYANSSLEGLIKAFKKLSNNEALVKDLNKFKDERNFLSHQGITHCLDWDGDFSDSTAAELQERLDNIEREAERLQIAIYEEASNFLSHLYFDDFPDE